jgi:hypothetical protein
MTYKTARNTFVYRKLSDKEMSLTQLHQLERYQKKQTLLSLERFFRHNFFQYSRDGGWMQDAFGPNAAWLNIPGIISWHVRAAIETLRYEETHGMLNRHFRAV